MNWTYWIKFENEPPCIYSFKTFEEFWHYIREYAIRNQRIIEWMVRE